MVEFHFWSYAMGKQVVVVEPSSSIHGDDVVNKKSVLNKNLNPFSEDF
jgi:hypothetical protein